MYPKDALNSIARLTTIGQIPKLVLDKANAYISQPVEMRLDKPTLQTLPVPHPLDYSWRFSRNSVDYILEICEELKSSKVRIILLGTPTILLYLKDNFSEEDFVLVDSDPLLTRTMATLRPKARIQCQNLSIDNCFSAKGDIIVVDSPWYPEYMYSFLCIASKIINNGGIVLLSFPAEGTRPNIKQEWDKTLNWANNLGLSLIDIKKSELSYTSPPFERNALSAIGIKTVPSDWRKSNLVIFRSVKKNATPNYRIPEPQNNWCEQILGNVRIRVRVGSETQFTDPSLNSIVAGDILPSVSRRDPRRQNVDIWTSGNRVFSCKGKVTLVNILKSIVQEQLPCQVIEKYFKSKLSYKEKTLIEATKNRIMNVVHLEHIDICKYYQEQ